MEMDGWEETPEWLHRLIQEDRDSLSSMDLQELLADEPSERPVEPTPAQQDQTLPLWLEGLEASTEELLPPSVAEPVEEPPSLAVTEEELPQWLMGLDRVPPLGKEREGEPEEEPTAAPAEKEGIPEWLSSLEGVELEPEPAPQPEKEKEPTVFAAREEQELPEWLAGAIEEREAEPEEEPTAAPAEKEGIPEWLSSLEGAELPPEPAPQPEKEKEPAVFAAREEQELPDWLAGAIEEREAEPEEEPTAAPAEKEGIPEWLSSLEGVELAPEPAPQPEKEKEPAVFAAREEQELPDWLAGATKERKAQPEEEALAFPVEEEGLTRVSELEESRPFTEEEERPSVLGRPPSAPAWVSELYGSEEEATPADVVLELPEGQELYEGEIPSWLRDLRIQEPTVLEEELPVETSGPLAGLRGLLNPEPLLGIFPKSTFKPTPPVPQAHLEEAKLISEILAAPDRHPSIVVKSPTREIVDSLGRWVVYSALLVAMLAAAFIPGLEDLVQPAEMPETRAFYNAVENLPQGSEVLLALDYDASLDGELTPQTRAIIWHLLKRDLGVVTVGLTPQSTAIAHDLFQENPAYVPGQHYINLGYLPPHPASLQALINGPFEGVTLWRKTVPDSAAAESVALEQRIAQFDDLDLIVVVSGNQDHVRWWIEQVGSQRSIDIVASVSAAIAPYLQPYYSDTANRQLKGMLVGVAGAAEYETLTGAQFPSSAHRNLTLQGCAQVVLVAVVLLSGVSVLGRTSRGK